MCTQLDLNNDKVFFLINHCSVIRKSYFENCKSNVFYSLKENLFHLIKRDKSTGECKRKRKKPQNNNIVKTDAVDFTCEVEIIKQDVYSALENNKIFIKSFFGFKHEVESVLNIDIDQENDSFSRIYGENTSNIFKIIEISKVNYIIPPKTRYFNVKIEEIHNIFVNETFDFIVIDPPWRNKYIRRLKKSKYKNSSAYNMLYNTEIQSIPIENLTHSNSIVLIWCTNSQLHQSAILNDFLPKWKLRFVTKYYWVKLAKSISGELELICNFNSEFGKKQPFEVFFVACPVDSTQDLSTITKSNFVLSLPSVVHSHKPPVQELYKKWLPEVHNFSSLELFARYLQPNFTSVGIEVLKLMNSKFYKYEEKV